MLNPGDRVVCIDNSSASDMFEPCMNIKKHTAYTISSNHNFFDSQAVRLFDVQGAFRPNRFMLLKDYRKLKLKKICSKQEIE